MIITLSVEQLERFYKRLDQKKGGGSAPAAPTPPDPVATAQA